MKKKLAKTIFTGALTALVSLNSTAAVKKLPVNKSTCRTADAKVERIQNRLRNGYKVREGERLKDELRMYKWLQSSCKRKRFKTS